MHKLLFASDEGQISAPVRISSDGYFADDIFLLDGTHKVMLFTRRIDCMMKSQISGIDFFAGIV